MKNKTVTIVKLGLLLLALSVILNSATAQKLPNVQQISLHAPANIKIDGKATEWNSQLQAYNHATSIYYTIANDDKNLYLIIQANQQDVINNIVAGGITFSIQKSNKKNDKNKISMTYPITKSSLFFNFKGRKGETPDTSAKAVDSIMKLYNNRIIQNCKFIAVTGIKDLDILSVYNENGIKAASQFDNRKVYTCELSIALEHLNFLVSDAQKFTYHIILNGKITNITVTAAPGSTPTQIARAAEHAEQMNQIASLLYAPTDFWGEYTLSKK